MGAYEDFLAGLGINAQGHQLHRGRAFDQSGREVGQPPMAAGRAAPPVRLPAPTAAPPMAAGRAAPPVQLPAEFGEEGWAPPPVSDVGQLPELPVPRAAPPVQLPELPVPRAAPPRAAPPMAAPRNYFTNPLGPGETSAADLDPRMAGIIREELIGRGFNPDNPLPGNERGIEGATQSIRNLIAQFGGIDDYLWDMNNPSISVPRQQPPGYIERQMLIDAMATPARAFPPPMAQAMPWRPLLAPPLRDQEYRDLRLAEPAPTPRTIQRPLPPSLPPPSPSLRSPPSSPSLRSAAESPSLRPSPPSLRSPPSSPSLRSAAESPSLRPSLPSLRPSLPSLRPPPPSFRPSPPRGGMSPEVLALLIQLLGGGTQGVRPALPSYTGARPPGLEKGGIDPFLWEKLNR
jgi:hypothetical protein